VTTRESPPPLADNNGATSKGQHKSRSTKRAESEDRSTSMHGFSAPFRHGEHIDFDAINERALAAFPRSWRAFCRAGSVSARRSSRSIRVAPIAGSGRSRSIATTVVGLTSRPATRAAIQFPLSPISAVSPRARQLGCSRECSVSKSGVAVVDDGCDPFAPLTAAELAIGTTPRSKDDGAGGVVSPIPDDAPPLPNKHPSLGQPTARWTYGDAEGAALFHLWRFDPPGVGKEFRPVTLGRDAKGLRWRWKAGPAPRPLYGLECLAARPDAPVIVCEGEKSADAARQIFPHCVVVTSTGGSQAALKADWMPLAGREVITWPDNDEPGSKYAAEVSLRERRPPRRCSRYYMHASRSRGSLSARTKCWASREKAMS
jgi:hypothetical protein